MNKLVYKSQNIWENSDEKATAQGYISISRVLSQPISLEVDSKVQENLCLTI